mmetsp:Transcript_14571/g.25790  ORF Transcript_14571/g.25790 Transcript_14571/m.25790 type:complete len:224 (+) Transcript_14571:71-742(+)
MAVAKLQKQMADLAFVIGSLKDSMSSAPAASGVCEKATEVYKDMGEMIIELEANAGDAAGFVGVDMSDLDKQVSDILGKMISSVGKGGKLSVSTVGDIGKKIPELASAVSSLHADTKKAFPGKSAEELGGRPLMAMETYLENKRSTTGPHWLSPSHLVPNNEIQGRQHGPPGRVEGGIVVHAAGVLADGLIMPQHGELGKKFSKCMASKAHCAWQISRMISSF